MAKDSKSGTLALTVIEPREYAILSPDSQVAALVSSNLAGEDVSEFDLDNVKVPAGGGTRWTIPGVAGDVDEEEIVGIIVYVGKRRQFWASNDPTGEPPDCTSRDMVKGVGNPGGECATCPHNEFGSAKNGHGKGCKETRALFVVRQTDHLPIVVNIPPGSLKNLKQYLLRLPVPYQQVITKLSLKAEKNSDGIKYSQVVPSLVTHLPGEFVPRIDGYAKELQKVFA
jgi:hypothetical protein